MNLRGAKPIVDYRIKSFIEQLNPALDLYNKNLQHEFVENFYNWITSSKLNNVQGLENFTNKKIVSGTSQAFDHWYWRHKEKRFRFCRGEFMYHSAVLKHGGNWKYIDEDSLQKGDAFILSIPFSDWGRQHDNTSKYLAICNELNIPVLLDFAYYPCTKEIDINLDDYHCVETCAFSISKAFYGAEFLRVGMRLERNNTDDGVDVFNSVDMINRVSVSIANNLITTYNVDYNWEMYSNFYNLVCNDLELIKTKCIMFGLGDSRWKDYNRGGDVNRVCVSELIGEKINGSSK